MKDNKDIKLIYGLLSVAFICIIVICVSIVSMNHRVTFIQNNLVTVSEQVSDIADVVTEREDAINEIEDSLNNIRGQVKKILGINYNYGKVVGVVAAESRGEPIDGQKAVAQTILERSKEWGMNPEEVVDAPGQYAKPLTSRHIPETTRRACMDVFINDERVYEEPIKWFQNPSVSRSVTHASKELAGVIGNHAFYY